MLWPVYQNETCQNTSIISGLQSSLFILFKIALHNPSPWLDNITTLLKALLPDVYPNAPAMALIDEAMISSDGEIPAVPSILDGLQNGARAPPLSKTAKVPNGDHSLGTSAPQTNGVITDSKAKDYCIPMHDQLAFTPRKIRVITIGAGFSGLMVAHKFQHAHPELQDIIEHKIFEARHDIGGTWLVNTYPGVQCDVPSHIYVSLPLQLMG